MDQSRIRSGRWRLGCANLIVLSRCGHHPGESREDENQYCGLEYKFSVQDILLGEGSESSVAELRPAMVNKYSGSDPFSILNDSITESALLADKGITKEESMREYADLKFSLLLYDAILILAGTSIASLTAGENTALAFLIGGTGGFLYLLLLQRSVDELPASKQIPMDQESGISRLFGGVKGPLLVLGSAFGLAFLIAKRGTTDVETLLTPKEVVVGMSGFLMCKVAVVLAAFKPLSMSMKD